MSLTERLLADYMQAMKAKETSKKEILNFVMAAIKNKKIELHQDPDDAEVCKIIKKEIKARQESIVYLEKAGNQSGIDEENTKIQIIQAYLPTQLDETQLRALISEKQQELWLEDLRTGRGKLIGAMMQTHGEQIDGAELNRILTSLMA